MKGLAVLGAVLLAAPPQAETEIRWKLAKGQELRYRFLQKMNVNDGLKMEFGSTVAMTVTGLDEKGQATLEAKYEAVSIKATGNQEFQYDSAKDKEVPAHLYAKMTATLVGKTFTFGMGPSGRIGEVKGSDRILADALKAGAEGETGFGRQILEQMLSDEFRRTQLQQMSPGLPEGKVAAGARWAAELKLQIPVIGIFRLAPKCTLAELKPDEARIEEEIGVEKKAEDNQGNPFAMLMELKSAKGKASVVFLPEAGRARSARNSIEIVLEAPDRDITIALDFELDGVEKK